MNMNFLFQNKLRYLPFYKQFLALIESIVWIFICLQRTPSKRSITMLLGLTGW